MATSEDSGAVIWISGLPSSGKSTLAEAAQRHLVARGVRCCRLDGDAVRNALVPAPAHGGRARDEFYASLTNLAAMLADQGLVVLVAATAHKREYRERARSVVPRFFEVEVDVPVEECRRRDTKGLYRAFAEGAISQLPGEDVVYERASDPEIVARGGRDEVALDALVALVASLYRGRGAV
jgi:adenylylsulfate kinase